MWFILGLIAMMLLFAYFNNKQRKEIDARSEALEARETVHIERDAKEDKGDTVTVALSVEQHVTVNGEEIKVSKEERGWESRKANGVNVLTRK